VTTASTTNRDALRRLETALTDELERTPGVLAAAIWLDDAGALREGYVAASPRAPLAEIRDTARRILERYGVSMDENKLQVAHICDAFAGTAPPAENAAAAPTSAGSDAGTDAQPAGTAESRDTVPLRPRFLVLDNLETHRTDNLITCNVRLRCGPAGTEGSARDIDSSSGRARAAARATLAAAEAAAPGIHLALDAATIVHVSGRDHIVVTVEAAAARQHANLAGIVALDRPIEEAAALAALGAIDRWIGW